MIEQVTVNTADTAVETENRSERRRRALKIGTVLFNKGYTSYACRIRNITDNGVMVEMESTGGIPSEFDFRIKDDVKKRSAKIIWREPARMGLRFV